MKELALRAGLWLLCLWPLHAFRAARRAPRAKSKIVRIVTDVLKILAQQLVHTLGLAIASSYIWWMMGR